MKLLILMSLMTLLVPPVFAQSNKSPTPEAGETVPVDSTPKDPDVSYFQKLLSRYDSGRMADFSGLDKVLVSGRCFLTDKPNKPVAAALLVKITDSELGPIDRDQKQVLIASIWAMNREGGFYDQKNFSQVVDGKIIFSKVTAEPAQKARTFVLKDQRSLFRQDDNYFYEKLFDTKKNETWGACYYFKINRPG